MLNLNKVPPSKSTQAAKLTLSSKEVQPGDRYELGYMLTDQINNALVDGIYSLYEITKTQVGTPDYEKNIKALSNSIQQALIYINALAPTSNIEFYRTPNSEAPSMVNTSINQTGRSYLEIYKKGDLQKIDRDSLAQLCDFEGIFNIMNPILIDIDHLIQEAIHTKNPLPTDLSAKLENALSKNRAIVEELSYESRLEK